MRYWCTNGHQLGLVSSGASGGRQSLSVSRNGKTSLKQLLAARWDRPS